MKHTKILVTGACGLIGAELCYQLSNIGYDVVAVDNGFRFNTRPQCKTFVEMSVQNFVSTQPNDFDYIFHMGNINGTKYFYDIPNIVTKNNVESDLAVFTYVEQNADCKLIYASSSEIVADTENFPTDEENDIVIKNLHNPRWSYRLTKMIGENYLKNSNLDYLIVRFFNVYSENSGSGHFVKDIIDKLKNENYELIGANETRSFCYVKDAVDAIINIKDTSKEIVNIGSDEEINILEAANVIAESLNIKNVKWIVKSTLEGSVQRRKPNINKLRSLYSKYNPRSFRDVINERNKND